MGGAQEVYHHSDTVDLRTGKYLDLIDVVNSDNLDTAKDIFIPFFGEEFDSVYGTTWLDWDWAKQPAEFYLSEYGVTLAPRFDGFLKYATATIPFTRHDMVREKFWE